MVEIACGDWESLVVGGIVNTKRGGVVAFSGATGLATALEGPLLTSS
jgi:hypothetical protein